MTSLRERVVKRLKEKEEERVLEGDLRSKRRGNGQG